MTWEIKTFKSHTRFNIHIVLHKSISGQKNSDKQILPFPGGIILEPLIIFYFSF